MLVTTEIIPQHAHRYAGSMVAACPVYAQTDKAFGKAETEDSEYVSADYHYISHRGVKVQHTVQYHYFEFEISYL